MNSEEIQQTQQYPKVSEAAQAMKVFLAQYPELSSMLQQKNSTCPCCSQKVNMCSYKIYDSSALALIKLKQLTDKKKKPYHVYDFAESTALHVRASHYADLRHWGLIEPFKSNDPKKKSSGFWTITQKGIDFVEGKIRLPEKIKMFNNTFFGYDGDDIDIIQALGQKFNYYEIMLG